MPKKDFSHPPPSPSQISDAVVLSFTPLFNLLGGGSPLSYSFIVNDNAPLREK